MALIVQKFGGTSLASIKNIRNAANITRAEINNGNKVIVVVSAMAGVTHQLHNFCSEISISNESINTANSDFVISSGEIVTAGLFALALENLCIGLGNNAINIKAQALNGPQIPIITDDNYGNSIIKNISTTLLEKLLRKNIVPIITGFQGVTENGRITTLGTGGSDITAACIAAALGANRCDIYTDVRGVYTADPRLIHDVSKINFITIEEMLVLASNGAKVLHPRAVLAAYQYGFEMKILSSLDYDDIKNNIENNGTILMKSNIDKGNIEKYSATAITSDKNLIKINIYCNFDDSKYEIYQYICAKIKNYKAFKIKIVSINVGQYLITIISDLLGKLYFEQILLILKKNKKIINFEINSTISTVTVVGSGMDIDQHINLKISKLLITNKIYVHSIELSAISIRITIDENHDEKTIKLLHHFFGL